MIVPIYAKVSNKDNTKNLEQLLLDKNYCFGLAQSTHHNHSWKMLLVFAMIKL
jgi:hypothetical protein